MLGHYSLGEPQEEELTAACLTSEKLGGEAGTVLPP